MRNVRTLRNGWRARHRHHLRIMRTRKPCAACVTWRLRSARCIALHTGKVPCLIRMCTLIRTSIPRCASRASHVPNVRHRVSHIAHALRPQPAIRMAVDVHNGACSARNLCNAHVTHATFAMDARHRAQCIITPPARASHRGQSCAVSRIMHDMPRTSRASRSPPRESAGGRVGVRECEYVGVCICICLCICIIGVCVCVCVSIYVCVYVGVCICECI